MRKLTKAQEEFFNGFVQNIVVSVISAVLEEGEMEMPQEALDRMLATLDLRSLRDAAGEEFLSRVGFTELKRVDKLMKSEEFQKVARASAEVGVAVQEELLRVIGPLVPKL